MEVAAGKPDAAALAFRIAAPHHRRLLAEDRIAVLVPQIVVVVHAFRADGRLHQLVAILALFV